MPRVRSLIETVEIDTAERAHNCQASAKHRIKRGDRRLKVRNGRSWDHYCMACAREILRRDLAHVQGVLASVELGAGFLAEVPAGDAADQQGTIPFLQAG